MADINHIEQAWQILRQARPAYGLPENAPDNNRATLKFSVPANEFDVPEEVAIEICWSELFPFNEVHVYSKNNKLRGFPHQMASNGKICLPRDINDVIDDSLLLRVVEGIEDWLRSMASGKLLKCGDVYELPDFDFRANRVSDYEYKSLVYVENDERFVRLGSLIGRCGYCKLFLSSLPKILIARDFFVDSFAGVKIEDIPCNLISNSDKYSLAAWVLLPDIVIEKHRPPENWQELYCLVNKHGVAQLRKYIRYTWEHSDRTEAYLLVGWPIPDKIGGTNQTIAWRACVFESVRHVRKEIKDNPNLISKRHPKTGDLWSISSPGSGDAIGLNWLHCENISYRDYTARWKLDGSLVDRKIALLGCGALGSEVADLLVRGGQKSLCLVDGERLEFGNLCRHTLSALGVGNNKAEALRFKLRHDNPLSDITAVPHECSGVSGESELWSKYEMLIDCTANDKITSRFSLISRNLRLPYAKMFVNPTAEYLTLVISGTCVRVDEVLNGLYTRLFNQSSKCEDGLVDIDSYKGQNLGLSVMAPGCWHPTYPGRWLNIKALAGVAVEMLEMRMSNGFNCDGYAAVIRHGRDSKGWPETRVVYEMEMP